MDEVSRLYFLLLDPFGRQGTRFSDSGARHLRAKEMEELRYISFYLLMFCRLLDYNMSFIFLFKYQNISLSLHITSIRFKNTRLYLPKPYLKGPGICDSFTQVPVQTHRNLEALWMNYIWIKPWCPPHPFLLLASSGRPTSCSGPSSQPFIL